MYLKHLKITNFKNISSFEEDFSQINCFVGNNGVGKTNILDAIHYLAFCKSYFGHSDFDSIKQGEDFFVLNGDCQAENYFESYSCHLQSGGKKTFKHSGKNYPKHSEHIGKLPAVIITPNDHCLIDGSSEIRRKFIDIAISQQDKFYLKTLINYNKAIVQRNRILKNYKLGAGLDSVMLEIIEEQMDSYSEVIKQKRADFFLDFAEPFSKYYKLIGNADESVSIEYKTYQGRLADILRINREKDIAIGHTSNGIHRDDLIFSLNQNPIRTFGSQGQQKSFLIALKLAQYKIVAEACGEKPILLLDDLFDKLDESRVSRLIELVKGEEFGQVIITDCNGERMGNILHKAECSYKLFNVTYGEVVKEE